MLWSPTEPRPPTGTIYSVRQRRGWPQTPAEWALRPYFINDYDISWSDLKGYLSSPDEHERAWAVAKVLDGARWSDVWRLITPDDVCDCLDRLPRRLREMFAAARRPGRNF